MLPARSLRGKPRCFQPQSPPGLLILLLQAFPGLGKPLNQALAAAVCCSLALAGAHRPRAAPSAPHRDPPRARGRAACTGTRHPGDPSPRLQAGLGRAQGEQRIAFFPAHRLEGSGSTEFAMPLGSSFSIPKAAGVPKGSTLDLPGGRAGRCHEDVYGWQTQGSHTRRGAGPQNPGVGSARSAREATKAQGTTRPRPLQAHGNGTGALRSHRNHQEQSRAHAGDGNRLLTPLYPSWEGPA